jgi:hypothetical protein
MSGGLPSHLSRIGVSWQLGYEALKRGRGQTLYFAWVCVGRAERIAR